MELTRLADKVLGRMGPRWADRMYRAAAKLPPVRRRLEHEYEELLAGVDPVRDVAAGVLPGMRRIPATGVERRTVIEHMTALAEAEESGWAGGHASGAVYHGDPAHIDFLNRVYALHSQANPLHADLWPSTSRFEAEIVSMTAEMLGAAGSDDEICGAVTSGGTESIILAMKAYRDRAGRPEPEVVAPESAHVAFDKAAQLLGLRLIRTPVGGDGRAIVGAVADAIGKRTIAVVGSAPGFPHGVIDPIGELSEVARQRGVGFHCDACLGGFMLPWAARLGVDLPEFDFRLPGVTSMSADTHKYGYAPKGSSVVLYRGRELRRHQYFTATDWPGGLYYSPTLAGSRPGALSAAAWAALVAIGEDGYLEATKRILETAAAIRVGIERITHLEVIGDPLWVVAFRSDVVDIYRVMEGMTEAGWSLNGLHRPPAVHLAVTLAHTRDGVAERFLADLESAVAGAAGTGGSRGSAPVYGMAASFPSRLAVADLLERYVDRLYDH